jgi:hypothetical protein
MADMRSFGGNGSGQPATGITWLEAAKFVNWLNTSSGHPKAYKISGNDFDLWRSSDPGYDRDNQYRNSLAHYFLPSADEWYKAAFYDPDADDGDGGYWDYPIGRDDPPNPTGSGTSRNTVVYQQDFEDGPARVNRAGGLSPYGVMGMGGNVQEWEETEGDLVNDGSQRLRGQRGGYWNTWETEVSSSWRLKTTYNPPRSIIEDGFRVAGIAEPDLVPGDFNGNGVLDVEDIDDLTAKTALGTDPPEYDLNGDRAVDQEDIKVWVKDLFGSWIGDANVDREFNSADMVKVFAGGKYEKPTAARWSEGDWNGDGDFNSSDMVTAFTDGGYEKGPAAGAVAVPEPTSALILAAGLIGIGIFRRRARA